jgi:plastocyanin
MRTSFLTLSIILLLGISLLAGCTKDSSNPYIPSSTTPTPTSGSPGTVTIASMAFAPASTTVPQGTTVTFRNNDSMIHTATGDSGTWDTGDIPAGGSKTVTFSTSGTFAYHCAYHSTMKGTIIVQ